MEKKSRRKNEEKSKDTNPVTPKNIKTPERFGKIRTQGYVPKADEDYDYRLSRKDIITPPSKRRKLWGEHLE